jgi:phage terminase large subunit GpA-like protein
VYLVGTHRAKDLLFSRLKLEGEGPGRFYWHEGARADYLEQLTGEVKIPLGGGRFEYRPRAGVRHEALDCEVYALHCARRLRLHLRAPDWWSAQEVALLQTALPLSAAGEALDQLPDHHPDHPHPLTPASKRLADEAEAREREDTPTPTPPRAGPGVRVKRARRRLH